VSGGRGRNGGIAEGQFFPSQSMRAMSMAALRVLDLERWKASAITSQTARVGCESHWRRIRPPGARTPRSPVTHNGAPSPRRSHPRSKTSSAVVAVVAGGHGGVQVWRKRRRTTSVEMVCMARPPRAERPPRRPTWSTFPPVQFQPPAVIQPRRRDSSSTRRSGIKGGWHGYLSSTKIHACVGDLLGRAAEEEQIAGCKAPRSTGIIPSKEACNRASRGITRPRWRHNTCVNPEQSYPKLDTPPTSRESPGNVSPGNGFVDGERARGERTSARWTHASAIHQAQLDPAALRRIQSDLKPGFERNRSSGAWRSRWARGTDWRRAGHLGHFPGGAYGGARQQSRFWNPARVAVGGAHFGTTGRSLQQFYVGAIDGLETTSASSAGCAGDSPQVARRYSTARMPAGMSFISKSTRGPRNNCSSFQVYAI